MAVSAHLFAQLSNAIKNGSATAELTALLDLLDGPGNRYYVNSAVGKDTHAGTSWEAPLATIDAAINKCAANDTVLVAAGHSENLASGETIDADVAGISIIGLGQGSARPKIVYDATNASFDIGANGVELRNLTFQPSVAVVDIGIDVEASVTDTRLIDLEFLPGVAGDGTDEFVLGVDIKAGCTRTVIKGMKYSLHSSCDGANACISLTGASDNVQISDCRLHIVGTAAVACIKSITTLSTNILIDNCLLTTDAEPGIELLTGTTGIISDNKVFGDNATIAGAIVSDGCAFFGNKYVEVGNEQEATAFRTASADD